MLKDYSKEQAGEGYQEGEEERAIAQVIREARGTLVASHTSEWALILFTLFLPASLGIAIVETLVPYSVELAAIAFGAATLGMLASIAHLAKPFRAPYSILNGKTSWLSREILVVALYWGLSACVLLLLVLKLDFVALVARVVVIGVGFFLLYVICRAYMVRTRPSWNGYETILELCSVVCGLGVPSGMIFVIWQTNIGWSGYLSCVLASFAGLILFHRAHDLRRKRLDSLFNQEKKAVVALSKVRYTKLRKQYALSLILQVVGLVLFALSFLAQFLIVIPLVSLMLCLVALVFEVAAQVLARWIFYELPAQTRHAPKWR